MEEIKRNYYGSLCTEMYEILHKEAPQEELEFYLSYAEKEMSILEPLCGSGRFFVPFLKRGFYIKGIDNSQEMLEKLLKKAPAAPIVQSDIEDYPTEECFDYIFISSGSVSLFTDRQSCISILSKMKALLKKDGKFFDRPINEFGIKENEAIFVDDNPDLLDVAVKKKLCPILMDRANNYRQFNKYRRITKLNEVIV